MSFPYKVKISHHQGQFLPWGRQDGRTLSTKSGDLSGYGVWIASSESNSVAIVQRPPPFVLRFSSLGMSEYMTIPRYNKKIKYTL